MDIKHLSNNRGQTLIEYLILTAVIAVATMGIVQVLGSAISGKFAQITNVIQGQSASSNVRFQRVEEQHSSKKDMGDFMRGSVKRGE